MRIKYIIEIKGFLAENKSISIQKQLPKAKEEMVELLIKEEEQLKAGDKNFNFSKALIFDYVDKI